VKPWRDLSPRERDALVAEQLMGYEWKEFKHNGSGTEVYFSADKKSWLGPADFNPKPQRGYGFQVLGCSIPSYTTDIRAAWEVRDKVATLIFSKRQKFTEEVRKIISDEMESDEGIHHSEVILRVQPYHICLAALKAVGVEV